MSALLTAGFTKLELRTATCGTGQPGLLSPRSAPALVEVSVKRAGSKSWLPFSLRSCFKLHCPSSLSVILTQGCHSTWLLAREATAATCQSHTWLLAPCPVHSGQPCWLLSARGRFVRLTADLHTHIFGSPASA